MTHTSKTPNERLRIIVTGLIAQYPLGGVTWDYLQYVLGLRDLGHEVYYLEDTGQWPFNPEDGGTSKGCEYNVRYLNSVMEKYGLADRWGYRFPWESQWFGLSETRRRELLETADLLINVSGTLQSPQEYRRIPRLIYIDSDPVFTQIKLLKGQTEFRRWVDCHDIHFTFGETLPSQFSATGHAWLPTRQPIVLDEWRNNVSKVRRCFTTIMNWTSYKPIEFDGNTFGQKDVEFEHFINLPNVSQQSLEIAVNEGKTQRTPRARLERSGWSVVHPDDVCPDMDSYRDYIIDSLGEWSIAKNGYVAGRSGWFSCRTACYLAAGRPAIVQDTGFSHVIPTGRGLFAFDTLEEAVEGLDEAAANFAIHSRAVQEIASEYFAANKVLADLLEMAA